MPCPVLEGQVLLADFLVLLQLLDGAGKAHMAFFEDIGAVAQGRGKLGVLLAQ
jgi:hypothetical protein